MKDALETLQNKGIVWSESELLRRLAMLYVQSWRGNKLKSATARRYNRSVTEGKYVQVPWYMDKVLYSILWERAIHSGMSISRILEFSVRYYLRRLLEDTLRTPVQETVDEQGKWSYTVGGDIRRRINKPKIFIIYRAQTVWNSTERLKYWQKYEILPFDRLRDGKIPPDDAILF